MRKMKKSLLMGLILLLSVLPIASGTAEVSALGDTTREGPTSYTNKPFGTTTTSNTYDLTNGDVIWINIIMDGRSEPGGYIDVSVYTPDGKIFLGRVDSVGTSYKYSWYIVPDLDTEGNCYIETMVFVALFNGVAYTITYGYYDNDAPSGTIDLTANDKLLGNTSISWSFTDSNNDGYSIDLYYIDGWNYNYGDTGTGITYVHGTSIAYWDTVALEDGKYTVVLRFVEYYDYSPYYSAYYGYYYYTTVYIDNENDPPLLNTPTIVLGDDIIEIWYNATDFNEDSLTYSIFYANDGINFVNELVTSTTATYYSWDTSTIPSGANYALKIVATDEHGATDHNISQLFSITGNERVTILTPTETETSTNSQTVSVDINFDGSVELFVNDVSKGSQTSGFSWDITLSKGLNEILAVGTNSIGSTITTTHSIRLLELITNVEPLEAESKDEGIVKWGVSLSLEDIGILGVLGFEYSIIANLSHDPTYNVEPGTEISIQSIIQNGNSSLYLTIDDMSEFLKTIFESNPVTADIYPTLESLGVNYNTISKKFEGTHLLPINLVIGKNSYPFPTIHLPILDWDIIFTFEVDLILFVQYGLSADADFFGNNFIVFKNYGSKNLNLGIFEDASKGGKITLKSAYGISIDNIGLSLTVTGEEKAHPVFWSDDDIIVPAIDESERLDSGPIPFIWVSTDYLANGIVIGKSESSPGFEIITFIPFFMSIIILRRRKKHKTK